MSKRKYRMIFRGIVAATTLLVSVTGCSKKETKEVAPAPQASTLNVEEAVYGQTPEGDTVKVFTLTDGKGMEAKLITWGATLISLKVPDKNGTSEDVTLGYDNLDGYYNCTSYIGASIGRYANRIAKGKFKLDGKEYTLATNNGPNHLHGGIKGFHKVLWKASSFKTADSVGVTLTYFSKDGEEGFPGNMTVTNIFSLKADKSLTNIISATSDKKTVCTFTHHSYFNLTGDAKSDILGHELEIFADNYTPVDATLIPTGEIVPVKGTPFDFTTPNTIGSRIAQVEGGYDHNFVLNKEGSELSLAARVYEPQSGRVMEVYGTEPAIQFYSGNFLDGSITGKKGKVYEKHYAFCLEPEHFPDSPNQPKFPSTVLNPGETHSNVMVFKFSTRQDKSE
jgi:aldose 1-epimerase